MLCGVAGKQKILDISYYIILNLYEKAVEYCIDVTLFNNNIAGLIIPEWILVEAWHDMKVEIAVLKLFAVVDVIQ